MKIDYNFEKQYPCIKIYAESAQDLEHIKATFEQLNVALLGNRGMLDHQKFIQPAQTAPDAPVLRFATDDSAVQFNQPAQPSQTAPDASISAPLICDTDVTTDTSGSYWAGGNTFSAALTGQSNQPDNVESVVSEAAQPKPKPKSKKVKVNRRFARDLVVDAEQVEQVE